MTQLLAVATACLATLVGFNFLLGPFRFPTSFALDLLSVIAGAYLLGGFVDSGKTGFVAGSIFGGAGLFLGTLVAIPLGAGIVSGGNLALIGMGILIGFLFGSLYAVLFGVIGGLSGYVAARIHAATG